MVGIRSFPFGALPSFSGELLVSGSVYRTRPFEFRISIHRSGFYGFMSSLFSAILPLRNSEKGSRCFEKNRLFGHDEIDPLFLGVIIIHCLKINKITFFFH